MRKTLITVLLLTMGSNSVSWAEPFNKPADTEKTAATPVAAPSALPAPLPAEMFQGRAREAYKIAAEIPEVLADVSCYCGCDKSQGHRNLLDCFVDDHGAG